MSTPSCSLKVKSAGCGPLLSTGTLASNRRPLAPYRNPLRCTSTTSSANPSNKSSSVDYLLADIGEGITECEIIKWFVQPGSAVEEFDVLVEVQSDKASVEITSRYAGIVSEHCYQEGDVARVGTPLCKIQVKRKDGEETSDAPPAVPSKATVQPDTFTLSASSESIQGSTARSSSEKEQDMGPSEGQEGVVGLATPAVRRVLRENQLSLGSIKGTGKGGRVTKEDVHLYLANGNSRPLQSSTGDGSSVKPSVEPDQWQTVPLSGLRKAMMKAMKTTWTIPHFGYSEEIDITHLDVLRREWQAKKGGESKLTLLPILIKALSTVMSNHAIFRCHFDGEQMTLREKRQHHISIALSTDKGLLTPTLPFDVQAVTITQLAEEVQRLQQVSRQRNLRQEEMGSGATLTLSNIGTIGGTSTFPLLPPTGQLIIGAMGKARLLPRFDNDGNLTKSLILPVSFSADHRVVEGVELARFVQDWKEILENPMAWIMALR